MLSKVLFNNFGCVWNASTTLRGHSEGIIDLVSQKQSSLEHLTHRCSQLPSGNVCLSSIALSLWNELDLLPKLDLFCLKFQKHFSIILTLLKFYPIQVPGFKNKATDICVSKQSNIYESCKYFVHNPKFIAVYIIFIGSIANFHFLHCKCPGQIVFIPCNWWVESLV